MGLPLLGLLDSSEQPRGLLRSGGSVGVRMGMDLTRGSGRVGRQVEEKVGGSVQHLWRGVTAGLGRT